MGRKTLRISGAPVWQLAANQHGVITRSQLLSFGLTRTEVQGRLASGRLHRVFRGVYAVGRPELTAHGWWMAAVLACGRDAVLSHESAAALWGFRGRRGSRRAAESSGYPARRQLGSGVPAPAIDISVPAGTFRRRKGIRLHRRSSWKSGDATRRDGIPVTSPARTLIDLATVLASGPLEAAVNEADKFGLIDPESLRSEIESHAGLDGVPALRRLLDRRTFALTDSELERRFLRLVRKAGLPPPRTRQRVNGFQVDFFWPELGLIVETDGLRYHRTPAQQTRDRLRDQLHAAAGLTSLRFTHAQIAFEPGRVAETLTAVSDRLRQVRAA
jgi:very-short-patch-repair endonuclease